MYAVLISKCRREGCLVAQIYAKGLHTNLLLTVKVTEDSRFCFAGVHKGSMELIALDISKLPGWTTEKSNMNSKRRFQYNELITKHSYLDPKLRGFGAVCRIQPNRNYAVTTDVGTAKYMLACGRGIKNVHIWTFCPDALDGPVWSFIYDVASNGNTIETVGFRDGGRQAESKSAGMCVRVWDLSSPDPQSSVESSATQSADEDDNAVTTSGQPQTEPIPKLPYEDIPGSHDVRAFSDCFGFGGTYEFAVVRLDAPRWANRLLTYVLFLFY
jgi:hypothetical protein